MNLHFKINTQTKYNEIKRDRNQSKEKKKLKEKCLKSFGL